MNPVEEMRFWELQVVSLLWLVRDVHLLPCPWLQTPTPCLIWFSAVAAGLFLGLGNSPFTHLELWFACIGLIVTCLSKPWRVAPVVFVATSGFSLACGVLCNVIFWAWKHDVMFKIWSRHFSFLKYIYVGVGTKTILRKAGILVCFEMYSGIILGQVTNILNLMESPEVKWYKRLLGNFWRRIFLTG